MADAPQVLVVPPPAPVALAVAGQPIQLPAIKLAPITDSANAAAIDAVRRDYADRVAVGLSSVGGGGAYLKGAAHRGQLEAAGYIGWKRNAGVEFGGELSFDLRKK